MSRTPLSVATRGRITTVARATLTLAVIGWLVAGQAPIQPQNIIIKAKQDGAGGKKQPYGHDWLLKDDEDILSIITTFVKQFF